MAKTENKTSALIVLQKNLPSDVVGMVDVIRREGTGNGGFHVYDLEAKLDGKKYELNGISLLPHLKERPNHSDQIRQSDIGNDILWPASVLAIDLIDNYDGSDILLDEARLVNLTGWVNNHILLPKGKDKADVFLFQNMKSIMMRAMITVAIDGVDKIFRSK
jgi:hypothetical protein